MQQHYPGINQKGKQKEKLVISENEVNILLDILTLHGSQRTNVHIQGLKQILGKIEFLRQYESNNDLFRSLQLESWPIDHVLFRQGQVSDRFYIILLGTIGLYLNIEHDKEEGDAGNQDEGDSNTNDILGTSVREVAKLQQGESFGELGLIYHQNRTATAICLDSCKLLVLKKESFQQYCSDQTNERLDTMMNYYRNLWIFRNLSQKQLLHLSTKTTLNRCIPHTIIIKQGQLPKGIFFVRKGIVKIIQTIQFKVDPISFKIKRNDYRDPSEQQIKYRIYEALDMEIDQLGDGRYFADYQAFNSMEVEYSAMTLTTSDILTVSVADLRGIVDKSVLHEFETNLSKYPASYHIQKQYFQQKLWKNYQNEIINYMEIDIINNKYERIGIQENLLPRVDLRQIELYDDVEEEMKMEDELQRKKEEQKLEEAKEQIQLLLMNQEELDRYQQQKQDQLAPKNQIKSIGVLAQVKRFMTRSLTTIHVDSSEGGQTEGGPEAEIAKQQQEIQKQRESAVVSSSQNLRVQELVTISEQPAKTGEEKESNIKSRQDSKTVKIKNLSVSQLNEPKSKSQGKILKLGSGQKQLQINKKSNQFRTVLIRPEGLEQGAEQQNQMIEQFQNKVVSFQQAENSKRGSQLASLTNPYRFAPATDRSDTQLLKNQQYLDEIYAEHESKTRLVGQLPMLQHIKQQ